MEYATQGVCDSKVLQPIKPLAAFGFAASYPVAASRII